MRPFHRRFGKYSASFEPAEASLIADLVDQIRQLLADRRAEAPTDPLAQLTGMTMGPNSKPADPAVARLLPDFHADDAQLSSGLRELHEPELIAAKDAAAVKLLDSLPRGGGPVRLDDEAAAAWMAALNDVRLALGVRLGVTDDFEEVGNGINPADPRAAYVWVYHWLAYLQESLVEALS